MKREEFDGIQIKTIENVAFLIEHNFGCNKEEIESHKQYIATTGEKMMAIAEDIFALTKYANSIFPECMQQIELLLLKKLEQRYFLLWDYINLRF